MKAYCTYCSAQKNASIKTLTAIQRYESSRIFFVHQLAQERNIEFFILSGKFGLLHPNDELPNYDHLLKSSEIDSHAKKVANQIQERSLTEIVFFCKTCSTRR